MTEQNDSNPMDRACEKVRETIAGLDSERERLVILKQDIELFHGSSPDALHLVYEAHSKVCEGLKTLRALLAAAEGGPQ
jgi:hypothetical protein